MKRKASHLVDQPTHFPVRMSMQWSSVTWKPQFKVTYSRKTGGVSDVHLGLSSSNKEFKQNVDSTGGITAKYTKWAELGDEVPPDHTESSEQLVAYGGKEVPPGPTETKQKKTDVHDRKMSQPSNSAISVSLSTMDSFFGLEPPVSTNSKDTQQKDDAAGNLPLKYTEGNEVPLVSTEKETNKNLASPDRKMSQEVPSLHSTMSYSSDTFSKMMDSFCELDEPPWSASGEVLKELEGTGGLTTEHANPDEILSREQATGSPTANYVDLDEILSRKRPTGGLTEVRPVANDATPFLEKHRPRIIKILVVVVIVLALLFGVWIFVASGIFTGTAFNLP